MNGRDYNPLESVEAIRLQNFMAFEDSGWIDLKAITLLFGENSSGKSAIVRALRLLQQSLKATLETGPLILDDEDGVDIGQYRSFIHSHETDRPLSISFKISRKRANNDSTASYLPLPPLGGRELSADHFFLKLVYGLVDRGKATEQIILHGWSIIGVEKYSERDITYTVFNISRAGEGSDREDVFISQSTTGEQWQSSSDYFTIHQSEDNPWNGCESIAHLGFMANINFEGIGKISLEEFAFIDEVENIPFSENVPFSVEEVKKLKQDLQLTIDDLAAVTPYRPIDPFDGLDPSSGAIATIADDTSVLEAEVSDFRVVRYLMSLITNTIAEFLQGIVYLGPLRKQPERYYHIAQPKEGTIGSQGQYAAAQYLSRMEADSGYQGRINSWLESLGIEIDVARVIPTEPIYEIVVTEPGSNLEVNLQDVGFGISQLFPILVEAARAEDGEGKRTIIIEQPELHLHPSAQVDLADSFIRMSHSGARFLIETHSEHLLLRLRRCVAESTADFISGDETLSSNDLAAFFIYRDGVSSKVSRAFIDEVGEISALPEQMSGFFSDDFKEILARTEAAMSMAQRQKNRKT